MAEIGANGSIDPAEDHRHQRGRETAAVANIAKHYKYPQSVGNDTIADNVNFNSHQSSEYAKIRMDVISESTSEPFMLFEFMTINQKKLDAHNTATESAISDLFTLNTKAEAAAQKEAKARRIKEAAAEGNTNYSGTIDQNYDAGDYVGGFETIKGWITTSMTPAERNYTGSIALYMPTDIQINDTMIYNEDTRKLGANIQGMLNGETDMLNATVLTDPAVLAAVGAGLGALPFVPGGAAIGAVLAGSIGAIASTEVQRHLGQVMNPNELVKYSQTGLRTFTFNWTILPDNEHESDEAAGLIKFFRKSAHAKRTNATLVTVPDHVITSFHGAKDMIQLPPTFIESVNVTYNPNNSSFFKRNNAPVEIGLSVSLKEIVPIYADDVEGGY